MSKDRTVKLTIEGRFGPIEISRPDLEDRIRLSDAYLLLADLEDYSSEAEKVEVMVTHFETLPKLGDLTNDEVKDHWDNASDRFYRGIDNGYIARDRLEGDPEFDQLFEDRATYGVP
jgi:cupin superfamily acireductone dioxygenase involved in methionine salvage